MTFRRVDGDRRVACDVCGMWWSCFNTLEQKYETVSMVRLDMRDHGWVHKRGKDYCELCKGKVGE